MTYLGYELGYPGDSNISLVAVAYNCDSEHTYTGATVVVVVAAVGAET